jgi:hypothetical protein
MTEVGDRVRVQSRKLGQAVREGVVTDVRGHLLRVRWSTGEESMFTPGPGSISVVGKVRVRVSKTKLSTKAGSSSRKKTPTKAPVKPTKAPVKKKAASVKKKAAPVKKKAAPVKKKAAPKKLG